MKRLSKETPVELLSTLAVATKQIGQGKRSEFIVGMRQVINRVSEMQKTCQKRCWREENGYDGPETGLVHAGRSSNNYSADPRGFPQSCPKHGPGIRSTRPGAWIVEHRSFWTARDRSTHSRMSSVCSVGHNFDVSIDDHW
jgi:hypothetical protein